MKKNKKKNKKKKININSPKYLIYIIIGVIALCLITIASTYAYFTSLVTANNNQLNSNSGKIDISYEKGTDINGTLYGTTNYLNGLNTTVKIKANINSLKAYVGIYLKINSIDNELKSPYLKWAVYKNNGTTPIKTGTFAGINTGESLQIVDNFLVPEEYDSYTVYIWLDGEGSTNDMQNKMFSASIYAQANYIAGQLE